MNDIAISVRNVSKTFRLYNNAVTGPLKSLLMPWRSADYSRPFHAVRDVSFEVKRGEVVGVVGANGAGKSTLLKMIAGLLPVDTGAISVQGRLTALLALGVGVNQEFTGRQNILFSGLLLGMRRHEIEARIDEIIDFAEIGEFIDMPMRTYSSGMRARLLFSISMSVNSEVTIIDEALATGDSYFVSKSGQRIRELCNSGATVMFVSHNVTQVEELCGRALLMVEGRVVDDGTPQEIVTAYNRWAFAREGERAAASNSSASTLDDSYPVQVTGIRLLDANGCISTAFLAGSSLQVEIDYECSLPEDVEAGLFLGIMRTTDGAWVGEVSSRHYLDSATSGVRATTVRIGKRGTLRVLLEPLLLINGHYDFWLLLHNGRQKFYEARHLAPFFAAREAHVHDRGPVFWQPAQFLIDDRAPQS